MSTLHQTAQMALDTLESLQGGCTDSDDGTVEAITVWCPELIDALREALAAPQPEPYGHVTTHTVTGQQFFYRYPSPPYLDTAKECIAVYEAPPAAPAPAVPAVCDGGTCGLGGYCANCPRQAAAPAVPVSWDRLRVLMDGIPTREEFIGDQRQQYVAKEAVMSWLHEGQLRAKREAVQPAAPTVQVVLRQPNLFASAPAVREPQDERAAFEAWAKSIGLDLYSVIGSQDSANPFGGYTRYAYEAWQARAHGIGGGGNGS